MALKVVQTGDLYLINLLTSNWSTPIMGVFVSPHTPADTDVLSDYTAIEASFTGYLRQTVESWTSAAIGSGGRAVTNAATVSFSNSSGSSVTVYGIFVIDVTGTILLWAEQDPAAPVVVPDGGTYQVMPQFTGISEF